MSLFLSIIFAVIFPSPVQHLKEVIKFGLVLNILELEAHLGHKLAVLDTLGLLVNLFKALDIGCLNLLSAWREDTCRVVVIEPAEVLVETVLEGLSQVVSDVWKGDRASHVVHRCEDPLRDNREPRVKHRGWLEWLSCCSCRPPLLLVGHLPPLAEVHSRCQRASTSKDAP